MDQEQAQQYLNSCRTAITYDIARIVAPYTYSNPVQLTLHYLHSGVFDELMKPREEK